MSWLCGDWLSRIPGCESCLKEPGLSICEHTTRVVKSIGAILLPQDCFLCGGATESELLCAACAEDLPSLSQTSCPICALPTPGASICGVCLKQAPHFDATHSLFRYAFPVDRLVQALKYQHRLAVASFFAHALRESSNTWLSQADLVLALPLSSQRLRERGFNQALEIARPLARQLGVPLLIDGYTRTIDTAPQASLPWKERRKNIQGAFECALDLTGKSVIVVDDVMTTGATLNEFARTLKKHGVTKVVNLVVARALRH